MATIICQHCERPNEIPDEELLADIAENNPDLKQALTVLENMIDYWTNWACGAER